jgi:hypothetical protein
MAFRTVFIRVVLLYHMMIVAVTINRLIVVSRGVASCNIL